MATHNSKRALPGHSRSEEALATKCAKALDIAAHLAAARAEAEIFPSRLPTESAPVSVRPETYPRL